MTIIKKIGRAASGSVYPNPDNGLFNVAASSKIKSINVYNLIGKSIFEVENLQNKKAILNLQKSPMGVYLLKVETERGTLVHKITISK